MVDVLVESCVELSRRKTLAEKLAEALEMMTVGTRLKRVALRAQNPSVSEDEVDAMLAAWLTRGA